MDTSIAGALTACHQLVYVSSVSVRHTPGVSCFPSTPYSEILEKSQQMWFYLYGSLLFKLGRKAKF